MKNLLKFAALFLGVLTLASCEKNPEPDPTIFFLTSEGTYHANSDYQTIGTYRFELIGSQIASTDGESWKLVAICTAPLSADPANAVLPTGSYTEGEATEENPSRIMTGEGTQGTYLEFTNSAGEKTIRPVEKGVITVTRGNIYYISFNLTDKEGRRFDGSYSGNIKFAPEYSGVTLLSSSSGCGTYLGEDVSGDGITLFETTLVLDPATAGGQSAGLLDLTFCSALAGAPEFSSATYTFGSSVAENALMAGVVSSGEVVSGSCLRLGGAAEAITQGELTVTREASLYNIAGHVATSQGRVHRVAFRGPIELRDLRADADVMEYCEGIVYGDRKNMGSNEYLLDVYKMVFTPSMQIVFNGVYLNGFMSPDNRDHIVEGRYVISSSCRQGTYLRGSSDGITVSGSYYYETGTDMVSLTRVVCITDGYYLVEKINQGQRIVINFSGTDVASGERVEGIHYVFEGEIGLSQAQSGVPERRVK